MLKSKRSSNDRHKINSQKRTATIIAVAMAAAVVPLLTFVTPQAMAWPYYGVGTGGEYDEGWHGLL